MGNKAVEPPDRLTTPTVSVDVQHSGGKPFRRSGEATTVAIERPAALPQQRAERDVPAA